MNPFKLLRGLYYSLHIIGLNEEYKAISQCETNEQIKKIRLSDIVDKSDKYKNKLNKL